MSNAADQNWDYIIVGAGPAGCVVANRLSDRPSNNVLLLEAGKDYPPGSEPPEILDIFAATAHSNPAFTWPGLSAAFGPRSDNAPDTRPRRRYTAGKVIGGSSSVNGMAAVRGLPSDYDHWAASGADGWDWNGVLPFFRKLESDREFSGPLHGKDGPIKLQRYAENLWPKFTNAVMTAVEANGWANIADQNGVFTDGYFPVAYNHTDTARVGPAWAYLTADVRRRKNLTVLGEHEMQRLLFDHKRCVGVEVDHRGSIFSIRSREVIVAAGALHTPTLLLRSGIGPPDELKALGIEPLVDRRGVGRNLMDHPGVNLGCFMKPDARLPSHLRRQMFAGLRWSSGLEGCPSGDMYLIPANKAQWHAIGGRIGLIMMWANRVYSRGHVRLTSRDPKAPTDIDFNMVSDERDMIRLVQGVRLMVKLQAHPAVQASVDQVFPVSYSDTARKLALYSRWNKIQTDIGAAIMDASGLLRKAVIKSMIADVPSLNDLANNESICREWLRSAVHGHWHASGTCRMGSKEDPAAVTNAAGEVYGVPGLRISDASLMPSVPCANTHIPTVMIGEKVAAAVLSAVPAEAVA
jgi:5-(hydroxymethyl)furfural/furfural oxidase